MNKKGQFFIIAAVIIVTILFGMASISTYAVVKPEPRTIFDLSSDLNRESYNVIEYGIYNKVDTDTLSESFTGTDIAKYFLKKTNNANIAFVYGSEDKLFLLNYITAVTGTISVGGSNGASLGSTNTFYEKRSITDEDGDGFVEVEIAGNKYFFDLKENEMFYFVIVQEREKEVFIERNEKPSKKPRPGGAERKSKKDKKESKGGDDN